MTPCANPTCDNPVPIRATPGRPFTYCSPQCRPSRQPQSRLAVEVDHPDISTDGRPTERIWTVRLRRGQHTLVIANDLGWPSANALAGQLNQLLFPNRQQEQHITN